MQITSPRRLALLFALVILALCVVALLNSESGLPVTVLNQDFRLLSAKLSHGSTHTVDFNTFPSPRFRKGINQLTRRLLDGKVLQENALSIHTIGETYALTARYTGCFSSNDLSAIEVEMVESSGQTRSLPALAQYYSPEEKEYGKIWHLVALPTNSAVLRLYVPSNKLAVAEVRIEGYNGR